ncbi:hypothetical protein TRV_01283 [Trichophyton verrucosum HKI 0517]|uniref:Uncharacterized protein n=1 Tax=Trichophyton verrucosum (strain HKI 0517) TaxID=663202 RepID=D4D2H8_TRIVH|nr:uncharacterized protein TRV_01283 [Trichophyton verrucosum HKI 0517]EFE43960.1 hypothetical protein TRV_01283 [Trichophyton verrucosum HKI 0517]
MAGEEEEEASKQAGKQALSDAVYWMEVGSGQQLAAETDAEDAAADSCNTRASNSNSNSNSNNNNSKETRAASSRPMEAKDSQGEEKRQRSERGRPWFLVSGLWSLCFAFARARLDVIAASSPTIYLTTWLQTLPSSASFCLFCVLCLVFVSAVLLAHCEIVSFR